MFTVNLGRRSSRVEVVEQNPAARQKWQPRACFHLTPKTGQREGGKKGGSPLPPGRVPVSSLAYKKTSGSLALRSTCAASTSTKSTKPGPASHDVRTYSCLRPICLLLTHPSTRAKKPAPPAPPLHANNRQKNHSLRFLPSLPLLLLHPPLIISLMAGSGTASLLGDVLPLGLRLGARVCRVDAKSLTVLLDEPEHLRLVPDVTPIRWYKNRNQKRIWREESIKVRAGGREHRYRWCCGLSTVQHGFDSIILPHP